jgi:hypothetical protein
MKTKYTCLLAAIAIAFYLACLSASQNASAQEAKPATTSNQNMADCPMMKTMDDHHGMVMKNGEKAMGFSQTTTTHHFLLLIDGGAIQVEANDASDTKDRDAIRSHLKEIAKQFSDGFFTTPFAVHGRIPDGVPEMDKLKADIQYSYEETANGARVRIATSNPAALAAIYDFLRFQINEHQTGDPLAVSQP